MWLCLNPVELNQVLIRPEHGGTAVNNILPKLANVKYLKLIDTHSGYHILKLDKKLSDIPTFPYQSGKFRYMTLPFGAAPGSDMFQRKKLTYSRG